MNHINEQWSPMRSFSHMWCIVAVAASTLHSLPLYTLTLICSFHFCCHLCPSFATCIEEFWTEYLFICVSVWMVSWATFYSVSRFVVLSLHQTSQPRKKESITKTDLSSFLLWIQQIGRYHSKQSSDRIQCSGCEIWAHGFLLDNIRNSVPDIYSNQPRPDFSLGVWMARTVCSVADE